MSDATLSVEVIAKMDSLAAGLKKGTSYISAFASSTDALLKGIENSFNNLDGGSLKSLTAAIAAQRLENERLKKSILQLQAGQAGANTATQLAAAGLSQQRLETERGRTATVAAALAMNQQRTATEASRAITEANRAATQQATAALVQQRGATEANRTAMAASRAQIAALSLANAQNRTSTVALSGSYREAQQRLTELGKRIREVQGGFDSTSPAIQRKIREYNQLNERLKAFDASMGNHTRKVGDYRGAIKGAATDMMGLVSGYLSAGAALQYVLKSTMDFQRIKTPLTYILGSEGDANNKLGELKTLSKQLGVEFFSLAASYKSFSAAARASNFDLVQSEKIFTSVTKASAVLGLSSEQLGGALTAIQQMISKGNVQAEELRGQLAERLPGAFALSAKAMGVTEQELNKLLKSGDVLAQDLLPKLAAELDKQYGDKAADGIKGLNAEWQRFISILQSSAGESSALSANIFEPILRGGAAVIEMLNNSLRGSFTENFRYMFSLFETTRRQLKGVYDLRESSTNNKSALKGAKDRDLTTASLGELKTYYTQVDQTFKKAAKDYETFKKGIADGSIKETADASLASYARLVEGLAEQRNRVGGEIVKQKKQIQQANKDIKEVALTSVAEIRKEITRLSKLDGSALIGSDVYNQIQDLKSKLAKPKADITRSDPYESAANQLRDFHNRSNIITKEGLGKDLQEWDDKYGKIKAVIAKLPEGARKTEATTTLETNYKEGKTNILEANSREIMAVIKKRNDDIALLEMSGIAKEIQQITTGYVEQIRLAEGNAAGITAIKRQQAIDISRVQEVQAAKDLNVIATQIADVAKVYREHQAEMFNLSTTGGRFAVELAENDKAKNELKQKYADRLIDFEDYQSQMAELAKGGNVLSALESFNSGFNSLIQGGAMNTLGGMGTAIGEAFMSGTSVLQAAGGALLEGFGSFLSGYGDLLIKYGAAAVFKSKLDAAAMLPGGGLAAGTAAIAAGIALKIAAGAIGAFASGKGSSGSNSSKDSSPQYGIPQFAKGVQNFAGGIALVGEKGPELVTLPRGVDVIPNHIAFPQIDMPKMTMPQISMPSMPDSRHYARKEVQPVFKISNEISMGQLITAIRREENSR